MPWNAWAYYIKVETSKMTNYSSRTVEHSFGSYERLWVQFRHRQTDNLALTCISWQSCLISSLSVYRTYLRSTMAWRNWNICYNRRESCQHLFALYCLFPLSDLFSKSYVYKYIVPFTTHLSGLHVLKQATYKGISK